LFYNSRGPVSGVQIGDGLYISCQPTGSSDDKVGVKYDKNSSSAIDFSNISKDSTTQMILMILISCLLFIVVFFGISKFYNYLTTEPVKFSFPKIT